MKLGLEARAGAGGGVTLWRRLDEDLLFQGSAVAGGDYPEKLSPEHP